MLKRLIAICVALLFPIVGGHPAEADIGLFSQTVTFTTTNVVSPWLFLAGQSSCAVVTSGSGSGFSITVQGASDSPPATAVTVTSLGTNGVITANGTFTGAIAAFALTGIRLNVTAGTGSETAQLTCSPAGGGSAGGGGSGFTSSFPYNAAYTQTTTSGSFLGVGGYNGTSFNPAYVDSSGTMRVGICGTTSGCMSFISAPSVTQQNINSGFFDTATMMAMVNNTPQTGVPRMDGGANGGAISAAANVLLVAPGGAFHTTLTSASATACTNIEAVSATAATGRLVKIINTGPATTVFPQFYDEGASPSCAAADLIWGDGSTIVVGAAGSATGIITLEIPLTAGLAYKLSGALTANLIITRN